MKNSKSLNVLYIDTDTAAGRSIEMYFNGFGCEQANVVPVSELSQIFTLSKRAWDLYLLNSGNRTAGQIELFDAVKQIIGNLPSISLGSFSDDLITSGGDTSFDDYFAKVAVSPAFMLRSATNLIERRQLGDRVAELENKLLQASRLDSLTGLWSRAYLFSRVGEVFNNSRRYGQPLCICVFGVQQFDAITARYGYEIADKVLHGIGAMIEHSKRNTDYAGPMGNEQFCVAYPNTDVEALTPALERIRAAISHELFTAKGSENFTVDTCFGVAQLADRHASADDLINDAKRAYDRAVSAGPGRICLAEPSGVEQPTSSAEVA